MGASRFHCAIQPHTTGWLNTSIECPPTSRMPVVSSNLIGPATLLEPLTDWSIEAAVDNPMTGMWPVVSKGQGRWRSQWLTHQAIDGIWAWCILLLLLLLLLVMCMMCIYTLQCCFNYACYSNQASVATMCHLNTCTCTRSNVSH
jgi:hypothetical protein